MSAEAFHKDSNLDPERQREETKQAIAPHNTEQGVLRDTSTDPNPEGKTQEHTILEAVLDSFGMKKSPLAALDAVELIADEMTTRLGRKMEAWKVKSMLEERSEQKPVRRPPVLQKPRVSPATTWQPPKDWERPAA